MSPVHRCLTLTSINQNSNHFDIYTCRSRAPTSHCVTLSDFITLLSFVHVSSVHIFVALKRLTFNQMKWYLFVIQTLEAVAGESPFRSQLS